MSVARTRSVSAHSTRNVIWRRAMWQGVAFAMFFAGAALRRARRLSTARSWAEMTTRSELEQYVRIMQLMGAAPLAPVSLRGWSAAERDSLLPRAELNLWSAQMRAPVKPSWFSVDPIRPQLQLFENSGWPYGSNDGAIWAGRGITTAVSGGFELRSGPLTIVVDPIFFRAENAGFAAAARAGLGSRRSIQRSTLAGDISTCLSGSATPLTKGSTPARVPSGWTSSGSQQARQRRTRYGDRRSPRRSFSAIMQPVSLAFFSEHQRMINIWIGKKLMEGFSPGAEATERIFAYRYDPGQTARRGPRRGV